MTLGQPTFFLTVTCNANWIEIQSQLLPGQDILDRHLLVCHVFKRKLVLLIKTLCSMFTNVGPLVYLVCFVEFLKMGLPHAHLLLKYRLDCTLPHHIDSIASTELPNDPEDRTLVETFMTHHYTINSSNFSRYCVWEDCVGRWWCHFNYPKSMQMTTVINQDGRVEYQHRHHNNCWVVPHCLPLLWKFHCHINFEVTSSSHLFQYLFKCIHKGMDFTLFNQCLFKGY